MSFKPAASSTKYEETFDSKLIVIFKLVELNIENRAYKEKKEGCYKPVSP